jgi:hypothetical protein
LHKVLDLVKGAQSNALQVHNRATRLDEVSSELRANRKTVPLELLVLDDERLHLSFRGGDFVELVQVQLAELFNIERAAVLVRLVVEPVLELTVSTHRSEGNQGK